MKQLDNEFHRGLTEFVTTCSADIAKGYQYQRQPIIIREYGGIKKPSPCK